MLAALILQVMEKNESDALKVGLSHCVNEILVTRSCCSARRNYIYFSCVVQLAVSSADISLMHKFILASRLTAVGLSVSRLGYDILDRRCASRRLLCQQSPGTVCGHGRVQRLAESQTAKPIQTFRPATD